MRDDTIKKPQDLLNFDIWKPYSLYSLWLIPLVTGFVWRRNEQYQSFKIGYLYDGLEHFYAALKFDKKPNAEIRCVIWIPMLNKEGKPNYLRQLTKYYPEESQVRGSVHSSWHVRQNEIPPRYFKLMTHSGNSGHAIGVLGRCVWECLQEKRDDAKIISIPATEDCLHHNITEFHFPKKRANRLTPDRRCFLFLPIMTEDKSKLLAVVLCDAKDPTAFDQAIAKSAIKQLPLLARALRL